MKIFPTISKSFKSILIAIALLTGSNAYAAFVPADILWVIDTSGSMGQDIDQIRTRIGQFNTEMTNNGIAASYGLVEFGGNVGGSGIHQRIVTDMTDFLTFQTGLNSITANHANPEDGSVAGLLGLNNITWTNGSVKNIILVTDEDDDSDGGGGAATCVLRANCNAFHNALTAENALFNVIRNPNDGNTSLTYDFLAGAHGGTAFNILSFRSDPESFFDSFIATKVEEIKNVPQVPVPAAVWLFGTAMIGLFGFNKRRKAA